MYQMKWSVFFYFIFTADLLDYTTHKLSNNQVKTLRNDELLLE